MSRLYYLSPAIHVVAELGIADHLSDQPVIISDITAKTGTSAVALKRLIYFLIADQVFEEPTPDAFRNTVLSSVLRDDHPQSVCANLRKIVGFW